MVLEAVPLFLGPQGFDFFQNAVGILLDVVFEVLAAKEDLVAIVTAESGKTNGNRQ